MSELKYIPISCCEDTLLSPLMLEEERAWLADLRWDYSLIRQILISFARQKLLPGYVAVVARKAVGYTYFLVNQAKGVIGSLYVSETDRSQEAVKNLITLAISGLKETKGITRVEAQIMPFHNADLTATFVSQGFDFYPRSYLQLDLREQSFESKVPFRESLVPWSSLYLESAAEMNMLSYRGQTDAEICEDYRTKAGCETYLRSLVENPGCGILIADISFVALDAHGSTIGLILCSRISDESAMIPQIAVHPSYQGLGLGNHLMKTALTRLKNQGFETVSLTVTNQNRRAFEWYQHLGFKSRKDFGAYVWKR